MIETFFRDRSVSSNDDLSETIRHPKPKRDKTKLNKLQKRLRRLVGQAILQYDMITAGDLVMVCLSGGKDSYTLLDILKNLKLHAPINFDLIVVHLDQQQPGYPPEVLPQFLQSYGVPFRILREDTYGVVKRVVPEGETKCALCSRLRRGILYRTAAELGATKIALGHHREDIMETFFLNLFFSGTLKAMPPKLRSDDGKHIVVRPLAFCQERDIAKYAQLKQFPIIPCTLCGSQSNLQRQVIKDLMKQWQRQHPGRNESIFRALKNVVPSHLADTDLFDFMFQINNE